ncbi:hypothetical protein NRIC_14040 [Enterococcus florum]|uniref:Uncharacterized protein n=1 Tax=Enterococcus florum TaxID=2480627 RepID=A0A4P5PJK4_9ENTE|nr:hypothetical protein [Enterococcus florum]GCF93513.1 hypothetical protein NRIC_14040 [Enterococcus florum]
METKTEFEVMVSNLANRFLYSTLQAPQRLLPLAETIVKQAQRIAEENSPQEAIRIAAKQLLQVMDRTTFVTDQFAKAVLAETYEQLDEVVLLGQLEEVKGYSDNEGQLLSLLEASLEKNVEQGVPLETIYYENYLVEYACSLMETSVLQHLKEKPQLLQQLKPLMEEEYSDVPYKIFQLIGQNFKKELAKNYYSYETAVRISKTEN